MKFFFRFNKKPNFILKTETKERLSIKENNPEIKFFAHSLIFKHLRIIISSFTKKFIYRKKLFHILSASNIKSVARQHFTLLKNQHKH